MWNNKENRVKPTHWRMATSNLSQQQYNFARFSIVCVDIVKSPLKEYTCQASSTKTEYKSLPIFI